MTQLNHQVREFAPWNKPRADGKHHICFLAGFRAVLAIPIQHYDDVMGGIYSVAVLLLKADGTYEIRDQSNGLLEILAAREQDRLPLSDPAKLEMLVETLASISTNTFRYQLYRNSPTHRVVIVREEIAVEEAPAEITKEPKLTGLRLCASRNQHRLDLNERRLVLISSGGGRPFKIRRCLDCDAAVFLD